MPSSKATEAVAKYIWEFSYDLLPKEIIEIIKISFLDWIAVTLGGVKETAAGILIDFITEMQGAQQASIVGHGMKTSVLNAALVNGTMSHILDYDDAHALTRNHTSAPIIPAILAIAESRGLSGRDLMLSYVIGFEVSTRIGLAMGRRYYEEGWHATSILGRFGAAAATSKLLKLNASEVSQALGLAATQSGGIRSVFGTMGKPFHAGKAAMDGMLAAMLAKRGFTGPEDVLDENSDFVKLFSSEYDESFIVNELGKTYYLPTNSYKLHAACLLLHPVIDGLISIREEQNLNPAVVDRIELEVSPLCLSVTDKPNVMEPLDGKFSIFFCSALAISKGRATSKDFSVSELKDPGIQSLMKKVSVNSVASLSETEANITIYTSNEDKYDKQIKNFTGGPGKQSTFEDILQKFLDSVDILPESRIEEIASCVRNLETLNDVEDLMQLFRACAKITSQN